MKAIPLAFVLAMMAGTAFAAPTDGQMGLELTQTMYCDVKTLFSGNIGMLVGLGIALMGLYKLIQGGGFGSIVLILLGASVTALPSLVESTLSGLGEIMTGSGISDSVKSPGVKC